MDDFEIRKGSEALAHSIEGRLVAVYGIPGAGKTTFCITATKNNRVLFIDTENAIGKVFGGIPDDQKNIENFASVNVKTVTEAIRFLNDPKVDLSKFDIIAFDSATHLIEEEMRRLRKIKKLTYTDWGDLGNKFKDLLNQLQSRGITVILTVHENETPDENGTMQHRPKTEGKAPVAALVQRVDDLLFIDVNEEGERILHTQPSPRYYAKSRDPLKERYVGKEVTYETLSADFTKIEKRYATEKELKELSELMKKAEVKSPKSFYDAIYWDGKGKLAFHNFQRGIELLNTQIEINKSKTIKPKKDVKSNKDS